MTDLLVRLFIKNSNDVKNPSVRGRYGTLSGCVGIVLNVCLFTVKLIAGLITGAISVTADAFNNLSDAGSSVVTMLGLRLAEKPADEDHPFGHGRIEYVTGLIISFIILLLGFELIVTSVEQLWAPQETVFSLFSVIVGTLAVLIKIWMFFFYKKLAKKIDSPPMAASAADSLSDAAATGAVTVGLIIFRLTDINLDAYLGAAVALFIMYSGFKTAKDSLSPLLGRKPDPEFVEKIKEIVMQGEGILGLHDLIIHDYGPGRCIVSLHAEVPANGDLLKMHDAVDRVEMQLKSQLKCEATIHMDPIQTDDETVNRLRKMTEEAVRSVDPRLSIHDFRIVSGVTHTNLIFDVTAPFDPKLTDAQITSSIRGSIRDRAPDCLAVMRVERPYI